ncbi:MAG: CPBP family intramembrane glutamic endopeptidase [Bacteroidota bacterium]
MEELEDHTIQEEKTLWKKTLILLVILVLCVFAGNLVLALLALAGGLSLDSGLDIFSAVSDPGMKPYIKTGIGLNHLILFTGSSLLFVYWLKGVNWRKYFSIHPVDSSLLMSFILLMVCAYPIIGASAMVFEGVEWANQMDESSIEALMSMLEMDGIPDLLVNLVIVALLPAIGEELLFRGIIQKELVNRLANPHVAIFLASAIFSGIHLQIQGFLPKLFIGLILGYAYYWTKSLWYPMILHFINNGMQTLLLFLAGDQLEAMEDEAIQPEKLYLIIGVVFSCFLCYLIVGNIRRQIAEKHNENV